MDESKNVDSKCIRVQIIPMRRFASERDITIKGCKIRKLREDEKQKIRNSTVLKLVWSEAERATFDFDFVIESSYSEALLAQDIIAALRIFKPFAVSTFPHIGLEIRNGEIVHVHSAQFFASLYDTTNGSVYALSEKEAEEFEEFCKLFFKVISRPYMRTAINRFSDAYRKGFAGDRLVDYVIALEALFSKSSEKIGYKLRLRVPMFLGIRTEIGEKIRIREYVKIAYEIRSGIVHRSEAFMKLFPRKMKKLGSQLEKKLQCQLAMNEQNFFSECFLPEIREITRKAIYGFITQSGRCLLDKTSILETIDNALLPTDK